MKTATVAVVVLVAAAFAFSPALAGSDGHVNFFIGQKSLDSDDWEPVEDQVEFGAVMSFGQDNWPVHIAVDILASGDEEKVQNITLTGSTFEVAVGVRKIWKKGRVLPYLGAGVAGIGAGVKADDGFVSVDADDAALGFWAGGGVFWRLGNHFNLGLDVRYSNAEVDLDLGAGVVVQDVSAGGLHYGALVGFGW
jgi:opacity protein-like surface antigen